MKTHYKALLILAVAIGWLLGPVDPNLLRTAAASHTCGDPGDPALCGELGPLIPFHKDAIHAGLAWSSDAEDGEDGEKKHPKICFWMRPSEYRGIDLVDPSQVDDADPNETALKPNFEKFVYGRDFTTGKGFRYSTGPHGLDESVATRIGADLYLDNGLCFDLEHPKAFSNTGKFNIADLTDADFKLNRAAFSNAGHSTGLNYNIFCAGQVALANGNWVFVGGHDKAGNNGIRKITIFNPATQTWADRGMAPVKAAFLADPEGADPASHPDPNNELNTDPPHPSDMTYQRWYPTAVHLPNDTVLILSGTDQDSSLVNTPGACASATQSPSCSKYRLNVPEIYDPESDRTIALENAWKVLSMYPIAYVVQTGPRKTDWKVAVIGEVDHDAAGGPFEGDFSDQARGIGMSGYDPWPYSGKTYLLDVQAALKDRDRDIPDKSGRYWELVDTAAIAHESGASTMLVKLDEKGRPLSQKLVLFGGGCGSGPAQSPCDRATVEMIDLQDPTPNYELQDSLTQGASQMQGVALPNGKVLITGGLTSGRGTGTGGWWNSFHYQLFDPYTGTITPLVETNNPLHDHATMVLLPDGSVINMGGNRTDKSYFTAPPAPDGSCEAGRQCSSQATQDAGVPVAQVFKPPYFFNGDRPDIKNAPDKISYNDHFEIRVFKKSATIKSVAMIQQHPVTHNHQWNRYVDLWFKEDGGELIVQAPAVPGLAPPGHYMVFVVNEEGVPSVGKHIQLKLPQR
jgi:hypothetical protein